ncbi:MAG: hypothetical protein CMM45_06160 [Rhodospirillaceae bacterium]|nr:hypothetical protein [Rhodospirillaceae bacterium]
MTEGEVSLTQEFSRLYSPEDLKEGITQLQLVANDMERDALAKRFGLLALGQLSADVTLIKEPDPAQPIIMSAQIRGTVVQECVVSLVPISSDINERIDCAFAPNDGAKSNKLEIDIEPDGEDPPEPIIDGHFDVGGLIAEHLGLCIEAFPRAEGAEFNASSMPPGKDDAEENPFSILKKLHER